MDREEIELLLQRINESWLMGYPEEMPAKLGECFDDAMVIKGPGFATVGTGKAACIQSYIDFVHQAKIIACTLSTPQIDVSGDTAVGTFSWKITYELNGVESRETGHDLFVFARREAGWRAVWRTMLPDVTPPA
ncbi:MAG TPA: DUF4440 domain-containing protein [Bryobacteraceae bacterium]|jgi:ketosteroid isomerase-like protein